MQLGKRRTAWRQLLHRLAEQHGEGDARLLGLLRHQGQLPLLAGDQTFLLGQFQCGGRASVIPGFYNVQHTECIGQIQLGNAQLLVEGQGLYVKAGDAAEYRQFNRCLIKLAGVERVQRAVAGRRFASPKVHFVAGGQAGINVVHRFVVVAGIQLAIAFAAQQFFAVATAAQLDFGQ